MARLGRDLIFTVMHSWRHVGGDHGGVGLRSSRPRTTSERQCARKTIDVFWDPNRRDVLVSRCHLPVRVLRGSRHMPYRCDQVTAPDSTSNHVKGMDVFPGVTAGPLRL